MLDFDKELSIKIYLLSIKGHYHEKNNAFLLKTFSVGY